MPPPPPHPGDGQQHTLQTEDDAVVCNVDCVFVVVGISPRLVIECDVGSIPTISLARG